RQDAPLPVERGPRRFPRTPLMASSAHTFEVKGVVEGFYGAAYSQREREDLLRFLGRHGYDTYFYGPKNDRQHRARWREPYDRRSLLDFRDSVTVASRAG